MAAVESEGLLLSRRVETLEAKLLDITSGSMAFRVFMKWHLPIFFLVAIGGGLLVPWPGAWIAGNVQYSSKYLIAVIFLCSGLRLKVDDIVQAFRCVAGSLWGIVLILCVTPLLALVLVQIPIAPRELPFGVALFAIMPTTLSSGVILTRAANGNDTLALLLTVVTNLAAIVIIPFTLQILLAVAPTASGSAVRVSIDPLPLLVSLTLCIVVPLALGKVLSIDADCARALCARPCPATAAWCNRACRRAPAVGGSGAEPDADAAEVDSEEEDAAAGAGVTGVLSGSVAVGAADAGAIELVAKDLAEVDGAVAAAVVPTPTAALGVTEAERGDAKCAASAETAGEPAPSPPLMCPRNPVVLGVTATKIPMKLFMSFALACIPWLKVSASAAKIKSIEIQALLLTLLTGATAHALFLAVCFGTSALLPLRVAEQKAVVLMGASKTLPVAVAVIDGLPASLGNPGIMTIGCILAHFIQLLIDAALVARWAPSTGTSARSARWIALKLKLWCCACRALPCACCRGPQCGGDVDAA